MQIEFVRPHVSDTYPDSLWFTLVPRTPLGIFATEYASQAREICILLCLERTWERGCHLDCTIHGKELGSILLRHRIKEYPDLGVHTIPGGRSRGLVKNVNFQECYTHGKGRRSRIVLYASLTKREVKMTSMSSLTNLQEPIYRKSR